MKTAAEAKEEIISAMTQFIEREPGRIKLTTIITELDLEEFFKLWHTLKTEKKTLYMPGELIENVMTIVYAPSHDHQIWIESEPVHYMKFINRKFVKS